MAFRLLGFNMQAATHDLAGVYHPWSYRQAKRNIPKSLTATA